MDKKTKELKEQIIDFTKLINEYQELEKLQDDRMIESFFKYDKNRKFSNTVSKFITFPVEVIPNTFRKSYYALKGGFGKVLAGIFAGLVSTLSIAVIACELPAFVVASAISLVNMPIQNVKRSNFQRAEYELERTQNKILKNQSHKTLLQIELAKVTNENNSQNSSAGINKKFVKHRVVKERTIENNNETDENSNVM